MVLSLLPSAVLCVLRVLCGYAFPVRKEIHFNSSNAPTAGIAPTSGFA